RPSLHEPVPVVIALLLRLPMDDERVGGRKLELRPAVKAHDLLPFDLEGDRHDRAGLPRPRLSVPRDLADPRILEDRGVELHGLLGPAVEPQARHDPLHRYSFPLSACQRWNGSYPSRDGLGIRRSANIEILKRSLDTRVF